MNIAATDEEINKAAQNRQIESLWCGVITLFPEMVKAVGTGVTGRAIEQSKLNLSYFNPRDYTEDAYQTVDDRPYGGGPGMVMMPTILKKALVAAKQAAGQSNQSRAQPKVIYLSPQGRCLDQAKVIELMSSSPLILIAGRYEGIDERFIESYVDEEISVGDYVLSGGELPAMVLIDAMARLIPGVLGHKDSALQDSFMQGLLDCPHYTRPEEFEGLKVPSVLQSGHHEKIKQWRHKQALGRTWLRRKDLIKEPLTQQEQKLLQEFLSEQTPTQHD